MSFFGLFGHHNDPSQQPQPGVPQLPMAPPSVGAAAPLVPPQLPQAPPALKAPSLFDKQHRQDTLLALGSGLLTGQNFTDGMSAAAQNVMGLKKQLKAETTKTHEFGGPDNSFEITTDPRTGIRTAKPVAEFQEYLENKRTKAKDTADINGRAMYALSQAPEAERANIYAHMIQNPQFYGIDPRTMPATFDPAYVRQSAGMGQTVAQATAAAGRDRAQADTRDYRGQVQADRQTRTEIYRDRAQAATHQGEQRIAQGAARVAQGAARVGLSRAAAAKKGSGGSKTKVNPRNSDLSYLLSN